VSSSNVRHGSLLACPTVIVGDVFDDRKGGKGGARRKHPEHADGRREYPHPI
jgi:hypothetical protein